MRKKKKDTKVAATWNLPKYVEVLKSKHNLWSIGNTMAMKNEVNREARFYTNRKQAEQCFREWRMTWDIKKQKEEKN